MFCVGNFSINSRKKITLLSFSGLWTAAFSFRRPFRTCS